MEKRACSASSTSASGAYVVGSAIRPSPSSATWNPSPTDTAITAVTSTSAKLVKLTPAANQKFPRSGGNAADSSSSAFSGSLASVLCGSIAATSG